jgi:hypothetical protein
MNDASCFGQPPPEWYKARIGHITSSMVYNVMLQPTKKAQAEGEVFSETAKSYLYKVAAERNISEPYLEDQFDEWLDRTNIETKAMRYGTENEDLARSLYEYQLEDGYSVVQCGFIEHPDIPNYGDSPDGVVVDGESNPVGCIEIKCPNSDTWMKYKALFAQGKTLKEIEEKHYWQCQSHNLCNNVQWCDYIFFDKMMKDSLQIVRIQRNKEDIESLEERIVLANGFIDNILKK